MFSSKSIHSSSTARLAITSLIAALLTTTPLASLPANAVPDDGTCDLTEVSTDNYEIGTADQLFELVDCGGVGKTFTLTTDIDLSSATNSPIGTVATPFTGTLDGSGNDITLSLSGSVELSLFASIRDAVIKDLTLKGSVVTSGYEAAGLALSASGTVTLSNLVNEAAIEARSEAAGFIMATLPETKLTILSSSNKGRINSEEYAGGFVAKMGRSGSVTIIGSNNTSEIEIEEGSVGGFIGEVGSDSLVDISNSLNSGAIILSDEGNAGGIIGSVRSNVTITMSGTVNTGDVTADAGSAGGFVGAATDDGVKITIEGSTNSGNLEGTYGVGGLVGDLNESSGSTLRILDSYNSGEITGNDRVGGLVGLARVISLTGSFNYGRVSGEAEVGGLIGRARQETTISGASNSGIITGTNNVGGLVGRAASITVSNAINTESVTGADNVGGLLGSVFSATVSLASNTAQVSGADHVGGLIGLLSDTGNLDRVFNSGDVTATGISGKASGLVGEMSTEGTVDLFLLNSFNSGAVSASNTAGFTQAFDPNSQLSVTNSYNVGKSAGDATVIGIGAPVFSSVYTNQDPSSELPISTDAQMQQKATYVDWDFDTVWGFVCGTNNNFPVLRFANSTATSTECEQTNNSASVEEPAPAPTYNGPTLVSLVQPVAAGSSVTFTGSKLDVVTMAMIGTTAVTISATTQTSLTIIIPVSITAATYDLVLFSSFGTLTVMGAVTVEAAEIKSESQAELMGWSWTLKFVGNSRSLSDAQQSHLENQIELHPDATTVICWGYTTAQNPNAWAIAHATQRAQAACNLVAAANSEVKTVVRLRYGVSKNWAMRSALQFWR